VDKVYPEWSQRAGDLRQSLLAMSSRLAPVLEGKSQDDIRSELKAEAIRMLESYCRDGAFCPQKPSRKKKRKTIRKK
jgi:hypothetical protein